MRRGLAWLLVLGCGGSGALAPDGGADAGCEGAACCADLEIPFPEGCRRVGPSPDCWEGWVPHEGGCQPILPAEECPEGTMAVIGEEACQPIGDCDASISDPDAVHVDASYAGGDSDGSAAKPFTSIAAAVAAAPEGGRVVVAAGEYTEDVVIDGPLTLEGRCPAVVTIRGGSSTPAVAISGPGPVTIRMLTVTGAAGGLDIAGAPGATIPVTIEDVVVQDPGGVGIRAEEAEMTLRRTLVAGARGHGLSTEDSVIDADRLVVRDTVPAGALGPGRGMNAVARSTTLRRSVFSRNHAASLRLVFADAVVEEVVVADTGPAEDGTLGFGAELAACPSVALRRSLFSGNRTTGILAWWTELEVDEVIVRDTRAQESDGRFGRGLEFQDWTIVDIGRTLVARSREAGIVVSDSWARVTDSVVRGTLAGEVAGEGFGEGIVVTGANGAYADLGGLLVEGNERMGVAYLERTCGRLHRSVVRENLCPYLLNAAVDVGADNLLSGNGVEYCDSKTVAVGAVLPSPHDGEAMQPPSLNPSPCPPP